MSSLRRGRKNYISLFLSFSLSLFLSDGSLRGHLVVAEPPGVPGILDDAK